MSLLVTRCVKRSHVAQEMYENWQLTHQDTTFASDIEQLSNEATKLCDLLSQSWQTLLGNLFETPVFNIEATGRLFQDAVRRSVAVVRGVQKLVVETAANGHALTQAATISTRLRDLEALSRSIAEQWPFADVSAIDQARSEYAQGQYRTAEDLLHAAQNGCAGTDK